MSGMKGTGHIVDFNSSDGLPPLVVQKLNFNFRNVAGFGGLSSVYGSGGGGGYFPQNVRYEDLPDKPTIENVTVEGDKTFANYGLVPITNMELEEILV